ncbi:hypothetical protein M5K25_015132 [Dendrobium thyrsiflorum]|uniref:t-SNARE coiled-coil homology domain-containing protein n=1 Tax=Dendrobium thyrsiflorum TaxID=117978 RepID=A0ABD0UWR8_DENTH
MKDLEAGGGDENQAVAMKGLEAGGGDENQDERQNESLRAFYQEVELLEEEIASISKLLALLMAANEESILAFKQDVMLAARDRIDRHILEVVKTSLRIRGRLEDMERRLSGCSEGTAVHRIRTVLTNMLRRKLKELLMDFQRVRQRIMADFMMEVRRRYFTVKGEVTSEEVLEKMFSQGKSEEILRTTIYSSGRGKVIETLSEIQDMYYAAKDGENSLLEFHRLFLDMAVLVDSQGEKMKIMS